MVIYAQTFNLVLILFRFQLRTEVLANLGDFKISTLDQVVLMASAIDVTTEVPDEINTQSGVREIDPQSVHVFTSNFDVQFAHAMPSTLIVFHVQKSFFPGKIVSL